MIRKINLSLAKLKFRWKLMFRCDIYMYMPVNCRPRVTEWYLFNFNKDFLYCFNPPQRRSFLFQSDGHWFKHIHLFMYDRSRSKGFYFLFSFSFQARAPACTRTKRLPTLPHRWQRVKSRRPELTKSRRCSISSRNACDRTCMWLRVLTIMVSIPALKNYWSCFT